MPLMASFVSFWSNYQFLWNLLQIGANRTGHQPLNLLFILVVLSPQRKVIKSNSCAIILASYICAVDIE